METVQQGGDAKHNGTMSYVSLEPSVTLCNACGLETLFAAIPRRMIHPPGRAVTCLCLFHNAGWFCNDTVACNLPPRAFLSKLVSTRNRQTPVGAMALDFPALFLRAADLTLASALSCFLYVLACFCLASLTGFVIFFSSFRVAKKMKRKMDRNGRIIIILASSSSIGQMLLKILDKAGFGGVLAVCQSPEGEWAPIQKECSSTNEVTEVPVAEENYQEEMHVESHLKGTSGEMKKPSATRWEEETEFGKPNACQRKPKNGYVTPAFLIALLCVPPRVVCHSLKKRSLRLLSTLHTTLMKFQD